MKMKFFYIKFWHALFLVFFETNKMQPTAPLKKPPTPRSGLNKYIQFRFLTGPTPLKLIFSKFHFHRVHSPLSFQYASATSIELS